MRNASLLRTMLGSAGLLAGVALACAALLAVAWHFTHEHIAANERRFLLSSLHDILPARRHDNDLYADTLKLPAGTLPGDRRQVTVYRAYRNGEPVAALFSLTTPEGYGGPIRLLVGVNADGTLAGVRVIAHRETPGLGDKIELDRSDWIRGFAGKSLGNPPIGNWAVKKDGGVFDQFTGATITPRAVVGAVKQALLYYRAHRTEIFPQTAAPDREAAQPDARP